MNLTINNFNTLKPTISQALLTINSCQSKAYKGLMKSVKKISKKAWVKTTFKVSAKAEKLLSAIMQSLHIIEKTFVFKQISQVCKALVVALKKDGLAVTGLLTVLSYLVFVCAQTF